VTGTLSAGLGQEGFNRDFKVVYVIGYCDLDRKLKANASNWRRCREHEKICINIKFICTK
jgi:hypothetical protein